MQEKVLTNTFSLQIAKNKGGIVELEITKTKIIIMGEYLLQ